MKNSGRKAKRLTNASICDILKLGYEYGTPFGKEAIIYSASVEERKSKLYNAYEN